MDSWRREQGIVVETRKVPEASVASQSHDAADDVVCPASCVEEVLTQQEFDDILSSAAPDTLVVFDFYKRSCGACKYIQPGFVKLCMAVAASEESSSSSASSSSASSSSASSDEGDLYQPPVMFCKHNILDEEDEEQTELAHNLNIQAVPMFKFYKAGREVESFATREKSRIAAAIKKHSNVDIDMGPAPRATALAVSS